MCWVTRFSERIYSNILRVRSVRMVAIRCIEMGDFGRFLGVTLCSRRKKLSTFLFRMHDKNCPKTHLHEKKYQNLHKVGRLHLFYRLSCVLWWLFGKKENNFLQSFQALSSAIATVLFACLVFSLYCSCTSSVPSFCHLLNAYFFTLTAGCTSLFHLSLSPPCCLSTEVPYGIQQCIWKTSMINICSFYSISRSLFKHSSLDRIL